MEFKYTEVWNFKGALRGMRNPLESWNKNDSKYDFVSKEYKIGENDLNLAQRLIRGGSEHRKFMRQIFVTVDITAPLYWFKEFDTYKIGVTSNSTSTMHKLATTPITLDCFETGDYEPSIMITNKYNQNFFEDELIPVLEELRIKYLETKDKRYWKELIRLLPESWLQTRTVTMNYENIRNIVHQRKGHKLKYEWDSFINWAYKLPNAKELIFYE